MTYEWTGILEATNDTLTKLQNVNNETKFNPICEDIFILYFKFQPVTYGNLFAPILNLLECENSEVNKSYNRLS